MSHFAQILQDLFQQFGPALAALVAALAGTKGTTAVKKRVTMPPWATRMLAGLGSVAGGTVTAKAAGMDWKTALVSSGAGFFAAQSGYTAKKAKDAPLR